MNTFELIGYMAGLCTAVCFLPQSIKTIKTRKTDDISPLAYAVYTVGLVCWIIYGAYLHSVQMELFNAIALVIALVILAITLHNLKKKK